MKCEYCGNNSNIKDSRGGCISCGAFSDLSKIKNTSPNANINNDIYVEVRGGRGNQLVWIYHYSNG